LVAHRLSSPILGVDFMMKTRLVLDVKARQAWFGFAPNLRIRLSCASISDLHSCATTTINRSQAPIATCKLPPYCKQALIELVEEYSDVLTSKLGLTHLIEYTISIKDSKPVRLAPYRLSPPPPPEDENITGTCSISVTAGDS
jgi:hypothetical protein